MPGLVILAALAVAMVLLAVRAERDLVLARAGHTPRVPFGRWSGPVAVAIPAVLGVVAYLATQTDPLDDGAAAAAVAVALATAVAGGAPLSLAVLHLADPDPQVSPPPGTPPAPGATAGPADPWLLRGGFWIGLLERAAIAFTILAGWPEGVAFVLVVKGFGRYPELQYPPAAERFIIGTLVSVLWAAACAWTALRFLS